MMIRPSNLSEVDKVINLKLTFTTKSRLGILSLRKME